MQSKYRGRSPRSGSGTWSTLHLPQTKISETLVAFAAPLLETHGDLGPAEVRLLLTFARRVWNAMIADEHEGGDGHLREARMDLVDPAEPRTGHWFETLVERRKANYGHDMRSISDFEVVTKDDGRLEIHAGAQVRLAL